MAALSSTSGPYSMSPVERITISPPPAVNDIVTSSSEKTVNERIDHAKRELRRRITKCRHNLIEAIERISLAGGQRKKPTWSQKLWSWCYEGGEIDLPHNIQTEAIKIRVEHAVGEKTEEMLQERNSSFFRWIPLYLRDLQDDEMIPHRNCIRECIGNFELQQKRIDLIDRRILLDKLFELLGNNRITLDLSTILKINDLFELWEKHIAENVMPSVQGNLSDLFYSAKKALSTAELKDLNNLICELDNQLQVQSILKNDESRENLLKDSIIAQRVLEMMDAIVYVADKVGNGRPGQPLRIRWTSLCKYELERGLVCIKTQSISQMLKVLARAHRNYLLNVHQNRNRAYSQAMQYVCRILTPFSAITEITEEDRAESVIKPLFGWMIKSINLKSESFHHLSDPGSCDLPDKITSKIVSQILTQPPVFDRPLLSLRRNPKQFEMHLVIVDQMQTNCIALTHKMRTSYFTREENDSFNFFYGNSNNKVKAQKNVNPRHVPLLLMQFMQFAANINSYNYGKSKLQETILNKIFPAPLVSIINDYLFGEDMFKLKPLFQSPR